ncbi:uncharacterized protein LOC121199774 isoform X3 [Toxotes jaculatrix]|uniref:uncharacterized protein LOC121199774 isoform X3 n=1 Tax=Toxotes jaculatrix TaxID=941984 RepID=UPI001B3A8D6C|nr:uncharacterized protein LOC121199774 isoform X3 [Toxotes jaculatrix]
MMAAWASSGALLLVLLTGASYSYPAKKGFDPSSSSGSSYGANPASAGSSYEVPSSGFAVSGSGAVSGTALRPVRSGASQPSARRGPAAASYSAHSVGSAQPSSFQPASTRDIDWLVAPPGPFSGEGTSPRPSARRIDSSNPAPELLGPSNYPPGTVTHLSSSFEQGGDYWQDTHYIRDYFPAYPDTQVVENFPTEFAAPPSVKQASQPVKRPSQPVKQSSRAPGLPGGYSMRKA